MITTNIKYVRVKIDTVNGFKIIWAIEKLNDKDVSIFLQTDKYGNSNLDGTLHSFVVFPKDIIWKKEARMNNHYAELEIVE